MIARVVIDASVALKWFLDDEADLAPARDLFSRWMAREADFIVPSHWPLEVLNGIRSAILKGRVDPVGAQTRADRFLATALPTTDVASFGAAIYRAAIDLGRTTYDAAYIVLAETKGLDFVTADERLFNAVKGSKPFVKLLRDYKLPPPTPAPPTP